MKRHIAILAAVEAGGGAPVSFARIRAVNPEAWAGTEAAVRRKFERDKRALWLAGMPLRFREADQGYVLDPEWRRPRAVRFAADERLALFRALTLVESSNAGPLAGAARAAVARLQSLDPGLDNKGSDRVVVVHPWRGRDPDLPRRLARCWFAIAERRTLRFQYKGVNDARPRARRVEPWGLFARRGHWYVVGRCADAGAERTFALARMEGLSYEGGPDGRPMFDAPRDFDPSAAASRAPWTWGTGRHSVILRARFGLDVLVRQTLGAPLSEQRGPEGVDLHYVVSAPEGLLDALISWLPAVVPLAPPELVEELRGRVRRTLAPISSLDGAAVRSESSEARG